MSATGKFNIPKIHAKPPRPPMIKTIQYTKESDLKLPYINSNKILAKPKENTPRINFNSDESTPTKNSGRIHNRNGKMPNLNRGRKILNIGRNISRRVRRNISEQPRPIMKMNHSLLISKESNPREDIKDLMEKRYCEVVNGNIKKIENIVQKRDGSFDEEKFMEYMYCNKDNKVKRSCSTKGINYDDFNYKEDSKRKVCIDDEADDDLKKLDKLSMLNMGARYELLNANKMMMDFDLEMVVFIIL